MNEEALGKKIKALRISNGLTQIQVAQALHGGVPHKDVKGGFFVCHGILGIFTSGDLFEDIAEVHD